MASNRLLSQITELHQVIAGLKAENRRLVSRAKASRAYARTVEQSTFFPGAASSSGVAGGSALGDGEMGLRAQGLLRMLRGGRASRQYLREWLRQEGRVGRVLELLETAHPTIRQALSEVLSRLLVDEDDAGESALFDHVSLTDHSQMRPLPAAVPPLQLGSLGAPRSVHSHERIVECVVSDGQTD